jgi:hypothetical protein
MAVDVGVDVETLKCEIKKAYASRGTTVKAYKPRR